MEFLGDVYDNLLVSDGDDAQNPSITEIEHNVPVSLSEQKRSDSSTKVRDESFESKTAVIDEAKGAALRLVEKIPRMDDAPSTEDELISAEEAVNLWKRFCEATGGEVSCPPSLDPGTNLLDVEEALVSATSDYVDSVDMPFKISTCTAQVTEIVTPGQQVITKISVEDTSNAPADTAVCKEQSEDFLEATLDSVGNDRMFGVDEESLRVKKSLVDEPYPGSLREINIAEVPSTAVSTKHISAIVTSRNESYESDYTFPEIIRGTKDIFANTDLLRQKEGFSTADSRHDISPDIFSNEFPNEDHPRTLEHLLWDRLAGLCEPLQLELLDESESEVVK